jgi:hypothetical protein
VIEQARPGGTEGERERGKSRESASVCVWCVLDPKVFRASIHLVFRRKIPYETDDTMTIQDGSAIHALPRRAKSADAKWSEPWG